MMASMCPPTVSSSCHKPSFSDSRFRFSRPSSIALPRFLDSTLFCRCNKVSDGGNSDSPWWDFGMQETIRNAIKQVEGYFDRKVEAGVAVVEGGEEDEEWDWERWRKHFAEVDEQERMVSVLKSQLASAIKREDYEDAATLKVAIAAAATNDTVGRVISHLKKCVEEERYGDASVLRDYAGTGLVRWWTGISEDSNDPYGRIIHIRAEYGRYIARSYSPRQLATALDGSPLFEVYLTNTAKGHYKQQAVYLKRKGSPQDLYSRSFNSSGNTKNLGSRDEEENKREMFDTSPENSEDGVDRDDDSDFDNVLRDMIPGVKVKVVKVTAEKVDKDMISKVIEQIIDEEEEKDRDLENVGADDEINSDDDEQSDIELHAGSGVSEDEEQNQIAVEVVVGSGLIPKISRGTHIKDLLRVPARLEKEGLWSFTFTVEEEAKEHVSSGGRSPLTNRAKVHGQRGIDYVMLDLVKSIRKGKIPLKVLKDVSELINLTLSQARNCQPLSGSTVFNRIDISSSDPLDGLYVGAHGLYTSEVILMKRRFGQWKEDDSSKKPSNLEFYEFVEAVKITGDPCVPAGQVAFRAKVGKRYQLPHKGIIPEEFGVIARYKGQGRLAEPGFKNPRWVDGELVILDGKHIKGGPVVGFVYWAPEFHFLVFFNRLRLQD
ncbi:protein EXECUTER 1, chloroplastic-like isoform X2 [Primulina eburnea]|uniref:protein EXECUTER 1, chloroplastic-like isoform X2 n=1 Tax=Primulina eburnea TaxID=1245227 RepID=UPI003C6C350E